MPHIEPTPLTLAEANTLVRMFHRHHKPTVGHKFSVGASIDGQLVGAAIVGRPVARGLDPTKYIEVTRLVVLPDTPHVCSFLYATAARIAKEFGYKTIQSYILESETGASLKAAGWEFSHWTSGGDWNTGNRKGRRVDQPMCRKQCWRKQLTNR